MSVNPYSSADLARTQLNPRHSQSFASLFDLNRQTIALLVDVAASPRRESIWTGWRALGQEVTRLNAPQREALAQCPFPLVDAGLCEAPRWSRDDYTEPAQGELPFPPVLLQTRLGHLAHAAWLLAWHLVRSDMIAARLMFALDSASTSLITQVTLTDIRRIAHEQVSIGRVRLRWHNRPDIWSRLILTARSSDGGTVDNVTTRGLQLYLREFVAGESGE